MTTKKLNKEYANLMLKAERAVGRKEGVSLLHRADKIRKRMTDNNGSNTICCSSKELL